MGYLIISKKSIQYFLKNLWKQLLWLLYWNNNINTQNMISICDILIFKTPFEDNNTFLDKFRKIENMLDDYLKNSWIEIKKVTTKNQDFTINTYTKEELPIEIVFITDNDFIVENYMPVWIISYKIDEFKFEKDNIESFLNDNIKFIYNVFFDDFFIDYDDKKYNLLDFNKWKKVDYKNLTKFDLNNPKNLENKQVLDSLMYLYFGLIKSLNSIDNNSSYIEQLLQKWDLQKSFENNIDLYSKRLEWVKKEILDNALKIKIQMDIFINLIK